MHMNEIFYAIVCINNHVLSCLFSMLPIYLDQFTNLLMSSIDQDKLVLLMEMNDFDSIDQNNYCSNITMTLH